jgi:glycosyltransferase involved in cell wall biosynthesis
LDHVCAHGKISYTIVSEIVSLNPFFSIVIPTYNRALLVEQSIRSVLAQSFDDFEIVIVDDGSTDNTEPVVSSLTSTKVLYFKKTNEERGAARNFGIGKASGKYVVFLDSDDLMKKNHLEVLYDHLRVQQEDFLATKYYFFNEGEQTISRDVMNLSPGYHTYSTFLIGNPLACCFTIRRENPNLIKFREEVEYTIMEDWIFLVENLRHSRLFLIDAFTLGMRDHDLRSMKGSVKRIIHARNNALQHLIRSVQFSTRERNTLIGSSDYFCAVHAYIAGDNNEALRKLFQSVRKRLSVKAFYLFFKLFLQIVWAKKQKES